MLAQAEGSRVSGSPACIASPLPATVQIVPFELAMGQTGRTDEIAMTALAPLRAKRGYCSARCVMNRAPRGRGPVAQWPALSEGWEGEQHTLGTHGMHACSTRWQVQNKKQRK